MSKFIYELYGELHNGVRGREAYSRNRITRSLVPESFLSIHPTIVN